MISDELTEKINEQIKEEFQSETYYLGMAAHFEENDWNGFSHFMKLQAAEEREHAMKFFDFLAEVDQPIEVPEIESPKTSFGSITEVFETALEQEKHITGKIHDLLTLARQNNDHEVESLLQWFVDEQVEEENLMGDILSKIRRAEGDETALLMIDDELSEREDGEEFEL